MVSTWLGSGVPPAVQGYLSDFTTRYMDPTEVRARFFELADETIWGATARILTDLLTRLVNPT